MTQGGNAELLIHTHFLLSRAFAFFTLWTEKIAWEELSQRGFTCCLVTTQWASRSHEVVEGCLLRSGSFWDSESHLWCSGQGTPDR